MKMIRIYTTVAAVLVAALLGGTVWLMFAGREDDQFAACRTTQIAGGAAAIGGPFELMDHTGRAVTDTDVVTKPSLLYFGYTFCPDVCPLDTSRNAIAIDILQEMGHDAQPVFISVDPNRDTPEVLAEFASIMHPDMIGLTGTDEQVRAASRAYRTYFAVQEGDPDYYLIDHSTFSYLVLPGHGFVEVFRRDLSPEQLAEQMACFIDAS